MDMDRRKECGELAVLIHKTISNYHYIKAKQEVDIPMTLTALTEIFGFIGVMGKIQMDVIKEEFSSALEESYKSHRKLSKKIITSKNLCKP